ncbi:uncharacterized protein METZ01_LOCUS263070, partial [marine metagenome]
VPSDLVLSHSSGEFGDEFYISRHLEEGYASLTPINQFQGFNFGGDLHIRFYVLFTYVRRHPH